MHGQQNIKKKKKKISGLFDVSVSVWNWSDFSEWWLWVWKKAFSTWFEILSWYFPWRTEENFVKTEHTQLSLLLDCLNLKIDHLKCQELLTQGHSVTSPKNWIFIVSILLEISNLEPLKCHQKPPCFGVMDEELGVMGRKLLCAIYVAYGMWL